MGNSPVVTTPISMNVKPQMQNWGVVLVTKEVKQDGKEKTEYSLKAIQGDKEIEDARKKGTLQFEQSVAFDFPANDEGFKEIIPDDEERMDTAIAGLKASRIGPRVRRALEDYETDSDGQLIVKFQPLEGNWDIRDLIKEAAKRKNLTPKEKAYKNLRDIPVFAHMTDAQLDAILASAPGLAGNTGSDSDDEAEAEQAEVDAATVSA